MNITDKLKEVGDVLAQGAAIVDDALKLDNGGQTLIAFVGEITIAVLSGGTDVPSALLALQNLNKIILNLKTAASAQTQG